MWLSVLPGGGAYGRPSGEVSGSPPTSSVLADRPIMGETGHTRTRQFSGYRWVVARVRLDTLLAERGLFASRTRAAASVMAGEVRVGGNGERAQKPGQLVDSEVALAVDEAPRFVSRGGIKLANALARFGLDVTGRRALDAGASTGGFTDCLLQGGAEHVVALDVAYGELEWRLRNDPRVTVLERTNARAITSADLPYAPDLVVIDVSFISLAKVLPALLGATAPAFDVLALVKPQFEAGRGNVGKGGVVRDPDQRRAALIGAAEAALALGAAVLGFASSGLPGPKGNQETFVWLAEAGRAGAIAGEGVEAAAREVEP